MFWKKKKEEIKQFVPFHIETTKCKCCGCHKLSFISHLDTKNNDFKILVYCPNCNAKGKAASTMSDAVAAWNKQQFL